MPIKDYDKGPLGINSIVEKLDQAGTAYDKNVTTSATDATSGRLLKVGDFGLGSVPPEKDPIQDDTDITQSGMFRSINYTVTPVGVNDAYAYLNLRAYANHRAARILTETGRSKLWFQRRGFSGGFTRWYEIYTQQSILGTVSQSNGVPTGAIIERGSNANGEYVKYADGTVDMWAAFGLDKVYVSPGGYLPKIGDPPMIWNKPTSYVSGQEFGSCSPQQVSDTTGFGIPVTSRNGAGNSLVSHRVFFPEGMGSGWTRNVTLFFKGRWY